MNIKQGERKDAMEQQLPRDDQDHRFATQLRACAAARDISQGRRIHSQIVASRRHTSKFLANLVIDMYGKCGNLDEARAVFDSIPSPNVFSWNIMIAAYALNGQLAQARQIFDSLPQRSIVSWNTMISAYTQSGHVRAAEQLFAKMPKRNEVSFNAMISAYAERGEIAKARELFEAMPAKNVVSWTAMLAAYAERGHLHQARDLFVRTPHKNVVSWTTMILAYVKNNRLDDAREMFDKMPLKNVVTWTTMIGAYGRNGQAKRALHLFRLMDLDGVQPNAVTFIAVADACAASPTQTEAKLVDSIIAGTSHRSDIMVVTALINLHGKCGCLVEAQSLFNRTCNRDLVLWTAIITAYAHNGLRIQALQLFQAMELQGLEPNEITYINVLSGAAYSGLVEDACSYFLSMVGDYRITPLLDHYIGMVHVLGRAGRLAQAQDLLQSMPFVADYVSWMTLLSACETHLDVERGILAAEKASGLNPETSSPYVVLGNIYAATGDAKIARALEVHKARSVKTDIG